MSAAPLPVDNSYAALSAESIAGRSAALAR